MRIKEVPYGKLKTPLKVNGTSKPKSGPEIVFKGTRRWEKWYYIWQLVCFQIILNGLDQLDPPSLHNIVQSSLSVYGPSLPLVKASCVGPRQALTLVVWRLSWQATFKVAVETWIKTLSTSHSSWITVFHRDMMGTLTDLCRKKIKHNWHLKSSIWSKYRKKSWLNNRSKTFLKAWCS